MKDLTLVLKGSARSSSEVLSGALTRAHVTQKVPLFVFAMKFTARHNAAQAREAYHAYQADAIVPGAERVAAARRDDLGCGAGWHPARDCQSRLLPSADNLGAGRSPAAEWHSASGSILTPRLINRRDTPLECTKAVRMDAARGIDESIDLYRNR
jgi:hypothetical protein